MGIFDPSPQGILDPTAQALISSGLGILANNHGQDAGWRAIGLGGQQGMQAYQQARLAPLQQQLLQAQASKLGSEAEQQKLATDMMRKRIQFFQGLQGGQSSPPDATPPQISGGLGPTNEAAAQAAPANGMPPSIGGPASDSASGPAAAGATGSGLFDKVSPRRARAMSYLHLSDMLMANGLPEDAATYMKMGKDMLPTLKDSKIFTDPRTQERIVVNQYDDGSTERLPYAPDLPQLSFHNTGAATVGMNPYTGQQVSSAPNSVTPDARLTAATTMRGQNITGANEAANTYFNTGITPNLPPGVGLPRQISTAPGIMQPSAPPQVAPMGLPGRPIMPAGAGPSGGPIAMPSQPIVQPQIAPQPSIAPAPLAMPPKAQVALAQSQQQERDKAQQTQADANITAANAAQDLKMRTADIRSIMQTYKPGPGQDWKIKAAKALNAMPGMSNLGLDKISSYDELEKNATRLAADQTKLLGSREAAQIFSMIRSANPNPNLTPQAMNHILAGLDASADYASSKAQAQENYRNQNGNLNSFETNWNKSVSPNVFALKYLTPDEQTRLFTTLKGTGELKKLMTQYQSAKAAGYLQ